MAENTIDHHAGELEDEKTREGETLTWRRAHFLSPIVNAWLLIFVFLFTIGRKALEENSKHDGGIPDVSSLGDTSGLPVFLSWLEIFGALWLPALFLIAFGVILLPFYIGWFFYSFAVGERNVYIRSGIFSKKERKVRLDRVQSIDINRSLVARILGLAELKFDVADGSDSALEVRYLGNKDAQRLRSELLSQVRSLKTSSVSQQGEQVDSAVTAADGSNPGIEVQAAHPVQDREEQILRIPTARLVLSMVLNLLTVLSVLGVVALVVFSLIAGKTIFGIFFANFAFIMGVVAALWRHFNTGYNFRLSLGDEGLKTRYGFTNTVTQTVPVGRIQKLEIVQPLLWRLKGWYRVSVSLAGKDSDESTFAGQLIPVATYREIQAVLPLVLADSGQVPLQAGLGKGTDGDGFTTSPTSARLFDPFTYRRNGFHLTRNFLVVRRGRLNRSLSIVPHTKIQNLSLDQGPWVRRRGLASLSVSTAGGGSARVLHIAAETARALFIRQAQLATRKK